MGCEISPKALNWFFLSRNDWREALGRRAYFVALSLSLFALTACKREAPPLPQSRLLKLSLERLNDDGSVRTGALRLKPSQCGLLVVDVWDRHWCREHTRRAQVLAKRIEPFLVEARKRGVRVLFAPSGTMGFYKGHPARERVLSLPKRGPPEILTFRERLQFNTKQERGTAELYFPKTLFAARVSEASKGGVPLPPWGQTGTCEDGPERPCESDTRSVWTRQSAALTIRDTDFIVDLDDHSELYTVVQHSEIQCLFYMGTATNMCVTWTRESSLMNMMARGVRCAFIEDMSIAITGNGYDPDKKRLDKDFSPALGSKKVEQFIKKYIAPSVRSEQFLR